MTRSDNFVYLTFALILLGLAMALAQQFFDDSVQRLVQSATVITLIVAVWDGKSEKFIFRSSFVFPLAIFLTAMVGYWLDTLHFQYVHLLIMLAFFISTANKTARQVLFTGEVDGNKILGAICLYMLIGLIWALLFTLLQLWFPSAFQGVSANNEWFELLPDFVYFSFVSLTTLGYGDISPTLPLSKFLVYTEAIVGQFYIAILVASLVGSRMSSLSNK